ncbi:uncharacterized protein Prdm16_0 isoform X2 [Zeugodacus cucurbitae]|uniref:uncharacterized protein Prdm16_0 isoform X2 n=1 Tax=Zeugodacus cucurbitae TaxID=28588 RepID=UPI0023D95DDD|nr:uncharacterized protein Prdm16_0 isoform X2 [Zeugodacus cucurbitae]
MYRLPKRCTTSSSTTSSQTPPPNQQALIRDYWYELKFSDLFKFINPDGRYQCPRFNCLKSYKDASSLQRHISCTWTTTGHSVLSRAAIKQHTHINNSNNSKQGLHILHTKCG